MIGVEQLMDILELRREGHSIHAIARLTGLSRNTARRRSY
jgi:transposase